MSCGAALFHLRVALDNGYSSRVELSLSRASLTCWRAFTWAKSETDTEDVFAVSSDSKEEDHRLPFSENPVPEEVLAVWKALSNGGAWRRD
jgi:hypothetical protein